MIEDDDEDEVVAELEVYSCRTLLGDEAKVCLMQYPLRPQWRPYELTEETSMRVKPKAKRVELTIPLDTKGPQYNEDAAESLHLKRLTLQSRPAELATTQALGFIRNGKLLLVPVDEAYQMRPLTSHLDEPAAKPAAPEVKTEAPTTELSLLRVQVQRRETERQIQMRLNSHAYISKLEADEEWVDIDYTDLTNSESLWSILDRVPLQDVPMDLTPEEYLHAILPKAIASQQPNDASILAAAHISAGDASTSAHLQENARDGHLNGSGKQASAKSARDRSGRQSTPAATNIPKVEPEDLEEFRKAMSSLFRERPVMSLTKIRECTTEAKSHEAVRRLGEASDIELHNAMHQSGLCSHNRASGLYIYTVTGSADVDKFRQAVVELLAKKASVRKAEVSEACKTLKLDFSDTQIAKQLREICISHGASWHLKESR